MATVPIPWFRGYAGGQNLYAGKALRKQRQLQLLTAGMYDVGTLLRKQRSKGLPPGWTDEDLANEEQKLEAELQSSQTKAREATTHGVERATKEGDPQGADAIKSDPGGYASSKHEESQGFLPKLGEFMKTGAERLFFGDPRRRERISHIQQMRGELAAEKDRENFAKGVGQMCMKTEDPDACLREMGGGRHGLTHLPKLAPKATAGRPVEPGAVEPPGLGKSGGWGGSPQYRMDWDQAERKVRERHGGTMPSPEVARAEIEAEVEHIQQGRDRAKNDDRTRRAREDFDYKRARMKVERAELEAKRAAAKSGQETISESWPVWKDNQGNYYQLDDLTMQQYIEQFPQLGLTKTKITRRRTVPAKDQPAAPAAPNETAPRPPADEDVGTRDYGVPFYAP